MKEKASNEWNNPEGTEPFMHRVGLTLGTRNTCEWSLPASSGFWGQWQSQQKHCSYSFFFPAYFLLGFPSPSLEGRTCWHRWGSKIKRPRESLRDCSFWFFFFSPLLLETGQLQATYTTVPRVQANSARQPCYEALSLSNCWQDRLLLNLVLFHNHSKGKEIPWAWKYNSAVIILVSTSVKNPNPDEGQITII